MQETSHLPKTSRMCRDGEISYIIQGVGKISFASYSCHLPRLKPTEEAGIATDAPLIAQALGTRGPHQHRACSRGAGPDDFHDRDFTIAISREHTAYRRLSCEEAMKLLRRDSNKTALWQLNERLRGGDLVARQRPSQHALFTRRSIIFTRM
jgi:hypothetical protein